jgi:hypothetical protein
LKDVRKAALRPDLLSSWEDWHDPPMGMRNNLTPFHAVTISPAKRRESDGLPAQVQPNDEHMGSITFGSANPTIAIGPALPPDIKINRDGFGRVRVVVATS